MVLFFWVELSFSVLYGCYTITSLLRQENEKKTNKVDNINGFNGKGTGLCVLCAVYKSQTKSNRIGH